MTPPLDALLSPQAQQAVIAGLFLAVGWWVVAAQNRQREAQLRAERVRDVQRAIFAEIRAGLAQRAREDLADGGAAVAARIEAEPGYLPVVPTDAHDTVFRAILGEIHVLPRDTIDPIVLYYAQVAAIAASVADLRALDPAKIRRDTAAQMWRDHIGMRVKSLELGNAALRAIANNLDGRRRVSSPGASASGQGSGARP